MPSRSVRLGVASSVCAHGAAVKFFVALGAQGLDGGAFAGIQHPNVGQRPVGVDPHLPAERVHLAHQMPLRRAADGAVAGHQRDLVQRQRQAQRPRPHPRRRQCRLRPRVARAHDDHVIVVP